MIFICLTLLFVNARLDCISEILLELGVIKLWIVPVVENLILF